MNRQELEDHAKPIIDRFVASYKQRFQPHVSDAFLTAFLMKFFIERAWQYKQDYAQNVAYAAAVVLFESLLEYGCKAGLNGHHVAQNFASCFPDGVLVRNLTATTPVAHDE